METAEYKITYRLCGVIIRDNDSVLEVESLDPPVAHVGCVQPSRSADNEWEHTDIQILREWARGVGWGGAG